MTRCRLLSVACLRRDAGRDRDVVDVDSDDVMSATAGDGDAVALTNRFIKIGHLIVNRVPNVQNDYRAITSALVNPAVPETYQSQRGPVPIGVQMANDFTDGLLFFEGGREVRIVAHDISQTNALVHSDRLGLLPIDFYITFDDFHTVGQCRLVWRYGDDIGVVFERWLDIRQHIAVDQAGAGECVDHRYR